LHPHKNGITAERLHKEEWLAMINLNTDITTFGVKPADGAREEYEDEGARIIQL